MKRAGLFLPVLMAFSMFAPQALARSAPRGDTVVVAQHGKNVSPPKQRVAQPVVTPPIFVPTVAADKTFTPLTLYFVTTTGSDSNDGLAPTVGGGHGPWATANHSVHCGDVVLTNTGSYAATFGGEGMPATSFGAVSNCPSTSGGIDGMGGIHFAVLLCVGPDLMSCTLDGSTGGPALDVSFRSNWAIEGFHGTQAATADRGCFEQVGASGSEGQSAGSYVAFINNMAVICDLAGFTTSQNDQTAIVGNIAYNAAGSLGPFGVCGSGISIVIPYNNNTDAEPHMYIAQNFLSNNTNSPGTTQCTVGGSISSFTATISTTTMNVTSAPSPEPIGVGMLISGGTVAANTFVSAFGTGSGGTGTYTVSVSQSVGSSSLSGSYPHSDGEGIIFDTWGGCCNPENKPLEAYAHTVVTTNNVIWSSGNNCIEAFPAGGPSTSDTDLAQYKILNNTCYGNNQDTHAECAAELLFNGIYPTGTASYNVSNNIFQATENTCGNNGYTVFNVAGADVNSDSAHTPLITLTNPPVTVGGNYIWNSASGGITEQTNNQGSSTWIYGTNTLSNPGLTSPGSLLSTAPDCTGYQLVTDCMNTKYSTYTHITPTIAPTTIGYQLPGPCVASDPNYPAYLKGITPLVVKSGGFTTSAVIVEKAGFITKPCAY